MSVGVEAPRARVPLQVTDPERIPVKRYYDEAFFELARTIQSERRHGNISTAEFIAFAKRRSGLTGSALDLLDDYFQQWLYGESKPTILPESFF